MNRIKELVKYKRQKYQRILLGAGVVLVILNGLFPPFEEDVSQAHLGYHFILAPPTAITGWSGTSWKTTGYDKDGTPLLTRTAKGGYYSIPIRSHIATSQFFTQFFTIVTAIFGAFVLLGMRDEKATGNAQ